MLVFTAPTIIVAGDETLYLDVSERLPNSFRVLYCETIGDTLDRAADANVVVVDAQISGGGEELCRRLRTDPLTAGVSVLLRDKGLQQSSYADQIVDQDIDATVAAISTYCPAITAAQTESTSTDPQRFFDLDQSTVSWRHSQDIDDWPSAPPTPEEATDALCFTRDLAGYVNSLVEAHESPGTLTPRQQGRLREMSERVLSQMDALLGHAQVAVNEALRAGNLRHMHDLSASKTALFEKLQRLRRVAREAGGAVQRDHASPTGAGSPGVPPRPATSRRSPALGSPGPQAPSSDQHAAALGTTGPAPHSPPPPPSSTFESTGPRPSGMSQPSLKPVKSQLTLAAERKAQQRRKTLQDGRPRKQPPQDGRPRKQPPQDGRPRKQPPQDGRQRPSARAPTRRPSPRGAQNARKQPGGGKLWQSIVIVAVVAALGLGAFVLLREDSPDESARKSNNAPPEMKFVVIQETPAGVVARPQAEDPEGDRVVYIIRWFVDESLISDARTARLRPQHFGAGSVVQVEVTPADAHGRGAPMRSQDLQLKGMGATKR